MRSWWNGRHAGLKILSFWVWVRIPLGAPTCSRGGMVYAAGLDPVPFGVVGSNPTESTKNDYGTYFEIYTKIRY